MTTQIQSNLLYYKVQYLLSNHSMNPKQVFKVITAHSPWEYEQILTTYAKVSRIGIISTNIDNGDIISTIIVYPNKATGFTKAPISISNNETCTTTHQLPMQ